MQDEKMRAGCRRIRRLASGMTIVAGLVLVGCGSARQAVGPGTAGSAPSVADPVASPERVVRAPGDSGASMDAALRAYRQGRWTEAYAVAAPMTRSTTEARRYEAAYVAGVAAMQAGRVSDASVMLQLARRAPTAAVRARAEAASGLLVARAGRHREAAEWLESAAGGLDPFDAQRALEEAAKSRRRLGDRAGADDLVRRARDIRVAGGPGAAPAGRRVVGAPATGAPDAVSGDGFTIQVGAFRDETRAREAALRAGGRVAGAGIGRVEVVAPGRSRSGLYTVRVGSFDSRAEAERMRRQLGLTQWVVAEAS